MLTYRTLPLKCGSNFNRLKEKNMRRFTPGNIDITMSTAEFLLHAEANTTTQPCWQLVIVILII